MTVGDSESSQRREAHDPRVGKLIDSFLERYRNGEVLSVTAYIEKHPDMANVIREYFPGLLLLENLQPETGERRDEGPRVTFPRPRDVEQLGRLGEFRLLRELGRGGMGVVYEAIQESLKRHVALKVLPFHSAIMDERLLKRFRLEAQAAARLTHPGVVPVYGIGEELGVYYYAMQYVPGHGLDLILREVDRLRSSGEALSPQARSSASPLSSTSLAMGLLTGSFGRADPGAADDPPRADVRQNGSAAAIPSPDTRHGRGLDSSAELHHPDGVLSIGSTYYDRVATVGYQVAGALAYAHAEGVLHRDIKPSNLLLDTDGKAWITDFGLAKEAGEDTLTRTGEILGTLRYMAPERFDGRSDARSDVYSLGVTLYELFAVRPAFTESERNRLYKQVLEEDPPALRKIDVGIPRDLETIVQKAIRKDPAERYQTALEVREELGRYLTGEPIQTRSHDIGYVMRRHLKRHPIAFAVATLVIVALALYGIWAWAAAHRARGPNGIVVADFNGDGRPDVATTNLTSGNVSVVMSEEHFERSVRTFRIGKEARSPCLGDFDGDGDLDLAALASPETLAIFENQNGRFRLLHSGTAPHYSVRGGLTAADLDGDGRADLAGTDAVKNAWIRISAGESSSGEPRLLELGQPAHFIIAADLDRDGSEDLVAAGFQSERVWILENRGHGQFDRPVELEPGIAVFDVVCADFNGDTLVDLAAASMAPAAGSVVVYLCEQGGRLGARQHYQLEGGTQNLAPGDLDGDSHLDLVVVGGADSVTVLAGKGDGTFEPRKPFQVGNAPSDVAVCDWDGDGDLDVLVTNFGADDFSLLTNDGEGNFQESRQTLSPWWSQVPWVW